MRLCRNYHDEICYAEGRCPLCNMRNILTDEKAHLIIQVGKLSAQIVDLKKTIIDVVDVMDDDSARERLNQILKGENQNAQELH